MTTTDTFNSLPFRDKLDLLYGVDAVEKRDLILGSPEAERLVRSFALESFFSTLKEIGLGDAADLVALASGEQLRGIVDLDCWKKDRFNADALLDWLTVLVEGGNRPLGEFLNSVDLSLLVFFLKSFIRIRRKEDPEEPFEDLEGGEVFELDEHYEIGFHRWDARAPLVRQLLEELYERDYGYFVTVMEEIWWGVDSDLEERSFQARNSRLQDRGFPDFYEALEIYRPISAKDLPRRDRPLRMRGSEDDENVPVDRALLLPEDARSFFSEIASQAFATENGDELRQELAFLTNRILVADGVDFADREAVTAAVQVTHDTLNLALESLAGGERARGVERLRHHHLLHLFRHGWHQLLALRRTAKRVQESLELAAVDGEIAFLDSPHREALAACARPKPRYFVGLDTPGETRVRTFASVADLDRARSVIDDLAGLPELVTNVLGQSLAQVAALRPADADEFRASAAILTGFARFALGEKPSLRPFERDELVEVRRATLDGRSGKLAAAPRERFTALAPAARGYLDLCFRRFEEEFLALDPELPPDPRFVTCLMIATRPRA